MYDEKDKSVHLSLIPFFVIKLENARPKVIKDAIEFMASKLPKEAVDRAKKESRAIIKKINKAEVEKEMDKRYPMKKKIKK
jgi:hypothetical protein